MNRFGSRAEPRIAWAQAEGNLGGLGGEGARRADRPTGRSKPIER
ncbi:MAG: hypothetical protein AAF665_02490 [Pseudomonadota bacterium]